LLYEILGRIDSITSIFEYYLFTYLDLIQNLRISSLNTHIVHERVENSVLHFSGSQFRYNSAICGKKKDSLWSRQMRSYVSFIHASFVHGSRNILRHDFLRHYISYKTDSVESIYRLIRKKVPWHHCKIMSVITSFVIFDVPAHKNASTLNRRSTFSNIMKNKYWNTYIKKKK